MNKLSEPSFSIAIYYDSMIENIIKTNEHGSLKPIYQSIKQTLVSEELKYKTLANNGDLNNIPPGVLPSNKLDKKDMKFLYTKLKKEGRTYYDLIKNNTYLKRCPYCEKRDVSELDHFLPQDTHPMYAVTPANLVPSCHDCNTVKLNKNREIIHPYFEDTSYEKWMVCEIKVLFQVMIVSYKISFKDSSLPQKTKDRIVNTVNLLELHTNYATWASSLISNKKLIWKNQFQTGGINALINLITQEQMSINPQLESENSYKKSFYRGFIEYLNQQNPDMSFLR